ncbi:MAG: hypothetical protein ABF242_11105 [Flavobacteriales bacterium]
MKLIKPKQISGEIMTLIEEADEKLILVSPYCNFKDWNKFNKSFEMAKKNEAEIEFYVRAGENKTKEEVKKLGVTPFEILNLHTKLYLNEKYGIVSSMNLVSYSDSNSLDIAYKTETKDEYDELVEYYNRFIVKNIKEINQVKKNVFKKQKENSLIQFSSKQDFFEYIQKKLKLGFDDDFEIYMEDLAIIVKGANRYQFHISNNHKKNTINANGILTGNQYRELDDPKEHKRFERKLKMLFHISRFEGEYDQIWHHSQIPLLSKDFSFIEQQDFQIIKPIIIDFITEIEKFKKKINKKYSW